MPVIKILPHAEYCPQGAEIEAPAGTSICEALLDNNIKIEHACDMSCACTTCHVVVKAGYNSLNEAEEEEEDLLDRAWGLELGGVYGPVWAFAEHTKRTIESRTIDSVDQQATSIYAGWLITGERPGFSSRSGVWGTTRVLRQPCNPDG